MCSVRFLLFSALLVAGGGVHARPALGAAELRDCAKLTLVDQQASSRSMTLGHFTAMRATLDRQAAAIVADRAQIDPRNSGQVAQYNQRVERACAEYRAYVAAFNATIADDNRRAAVFNADCADRDFDPTTVAELPVELRAAWRSALGQASATETAMLLAGDLRSVPQPFAR